MRDFLDKLLSWCTLPVLGMVFTVNYLLFVYLRFNDRFFQLEKMPLNEVGDFLAGVFGPVAFGWLIIGYVMQNGELKLNRISIEKQAEELGLTRLAYEQQIAEFKASVDVAKDSFFFNKMIYLEKRRESVYKNQPRISSIEIAINSNERDFISNLEIIKRLVLKFYNDGSNASSISIFSLMLNKELFGFPLLEKGAKSIDLNYDTSKADLSGCKSLSVGKETNFDNIQISYNDINNIPQEMDIILFVTREETDKYIFRGEFVSHHDTSMDVVGD
tara:strand:- start:1827 stop:2648 length:822 start_codon:yes stop_codon:yes gene_type:complete